METELGMGLDTVEVSRLDATTHALVRLAAALGLVERLRPRAGPAPDRFHPIEAMSAKWRDEIIFPILWIVGALMAPTPKAAAAEAQAGLQ
jgi:hypothetical protein